MKKIICKVMEFLFPAACAAHRRRAALMRAERTAAMDAMLRASRKMREDGRSVEHINGLLGYALWQYRKGRYEQCAFDSKVSMRSF